LPPDIQAHTIRLLARLLRQHLDHVMTLGVMREMGDE
jgi:hypothetical protein